MSGGKGESDEREIENVVNDEIDRCEETISGC